MFKKTTRILVIYTVVVPKFQMLKSKPKVCSFFFRVDRGFRFYVSQKLIPIRHNNFNNNY